MTPFVAIYLTCSVLVFLLCFQPLIWQITHHNIPASSNITFIMFILLTNIINASIWPEAISMTDWPGFIFCDIEIKLVMVAKYGIYGSVAAMLRNLAKILNPSSMALPTRKQKIIDLSFSCMLCFGLPLIMPALQYLVMTFRYALYPVAGCEDSNDSSWLGILLLAGPILVLDLFVAYYGVLTLLRLRRHRKTVTTILLSSPTASSTSTTTKTRYYRLLSLSLITSLLIVPSSIANTIYRLNLGNIQSYSFHSLTTYAFNYVTVYWGDGPTQGGDFNIESGLGITTNPTWSRFSYVFLGLCIVLILGCGKDAGQMYRKWFGVLIPRLRARQTSDASAVSWDRTTTASSWRHSMTSILKTVWANASKRSLRLKSKRARGSDASTTSGLPISPRSLQHARVIKEGEVEVAEMRLHGMVYRHDGDLV